MWHARRQETAYRFLWGNLRERDPLVDLGVDGQNFLYVATKRTTVTPLICAKITFLKRFLCKYSYTEFHENSTQALITAIRPQKDGQSGRVST